jgi:hypothetical protein
MQAPGIRIKQLKKTFFRILMALEQLSRTVDLTQEQDETVEWCNKAVADCGALSHKQVAIFAYTNRQNTNEKYLGTSTKLKEERFQFFPLNPESAIDLTGDQVAFRFNQGAIESCMNFVYSRFFYDKSFEIDITFN